MQHVQFEIVFDDPSCFLIRDIGFRDQYITIANDAEFVVEFLLQSNILKPEQRLEYIDSEGQRAQILHQHGRFAGFAPAEVADGGL